MANKKGIAIVLSVALLGLLIIAAIAAFGFIRFVKIDHSKQQAREAHLASVEQYVNDVSEKRSGKPPDFLYYVEYRVLKQPYPTISTVQTVLGPPDSRKESHDGIQLEWRGAPSSDDLLLSAEFGNDQLLKKIDYHYQHEIIGRWPSEWQKDIPITIGSPR
jgi:hypothetical protein